MATLGGGQYAPDTSFPTCRASGLCSHSPGPGLPGLGPRGRRGRGPGRRLGFRQPGPRGLRAPQPWAGWDAKAPRGAQLSPSWSSGRGGPRGLLLVRDSSCCPRVPRFGVSVYRNWGCLGPPDLGAFRAGSSCFEVWSCIDQDLEKGGPAMPDRKGHCVLGLGGPRLKKGSLRGTVKTSLVF